MERLRRKYVFVCFGSVAGLLLWSLLSIDDIDHKGVPKSHSRNNKDQRRNHRKTLSESDLRIKAVYPWHGSKVPPRVMNLTFSDVTMTKWLEIQAARRDRMREVCHEISHLREQHQEYKLYPGFHSHAGKSLIDTKHQLFYCPIPKCSCTSWTELLLKATGKFHLGTKEHVHSLKVQQRSGLNQFRELSRAQVSDVMTYRKFLVVRHPLARLVSAYKHKFENPDTQERWHRDYGREIIRNYRVNPNSDDVRTGRGVTYAEFIRYVTDFSKSHVNPHWERYIDTCNPCEINYDFIVKLETIDIDSYFLLHILYDNLDEIGLKLPRRNPTASNTQAVKQEYMSQLTSEEKENLLDLYQWDIKMFDYDDTPEI